MKILFFKEKRREHIFYSAVPDTYWTIMNSRFLFYSYEWNIDGRFHHGTTANASPDNSVNS